MTIGKALEDRRQDVCPRCRGGGQRQRAALGVAERLKLLAHTLECVEDAGGVLSDETPGFGEPAGPPVSLDEVLSDGCLKGLEVLGRGRLADSAGLRGRGYGATPPDLDKQPQPKRVECVNYARRESHV